MERKNQVEATITLGDGVLTIARNGSSKVTVANILGTITEGGNDYWYLDRLVHAPHETDLGEYKVSGAISSRLAKPQSVSS